MSPLRTRVQAEEARCAEAFDAVLRFHRTFCEGGEILLKEGVEVFVVL